MTPTAAVAAPAVAAPAAVLVVEVPAVAAAPATASPRTSRSAVAAVPAPAASRSPAARTETESRSPSSLRPPTPPTAPTITNPTTTIAPFGPAPIGVPNFVIDSFEIPPFLLPIYQACGTQYGIPWQVLASINKIETAFGTNLNVSSAGAVGWMQFIPSTWEAYGVDANGDGRKDPYNPVDAICAAARYLRAAGGEEDLYNAIFAYNHADWYVEEVLLYARAYGKLPDDLVSSLTGLTEGAHFPVAADARYADDISAREALARARPPAPGSPTATRPRSSPPRRPGAGSTSSPADGAPVVAVNDGVIQARSAATRSSAATSSSRTPTATASPTPSSAASSASTRCRSRRG